MNCRSCPICNTPASSAKMFLKQNIDPTKMSTFSFASRKLPEFMCHQLMQCPTCDLVYADDPPGQAVLAEAYHVSDFDSAQEADDAAAAYTKAVAPILSCITNKESALEIGTGTGIFLDYLKTAGFQKLVGIEPSSAAIAAAPAHRQAWIHETIFKECDFAAESFDFICCFMTLEHVRDPNEIASAASRLLRPGGAVAFVTHDYRSPVNRILGRWSPIIDIEHMQLFSPESIRHLLVRNGFTDVQAHSFQNCYAMRYWMKLLPVGVAIKQSAVKFLASIGLADMRVALNVGNMISYGYRPKS